VRALGHSIGQTPNTGIGVFFKFNHVWKLYQQTNNGCVEKQNRKIISQVTDMQTACFTISRQMLI